MAQNITKLYLLNVPLENDYLHTFYFGSTTEQYNYFYSRLMKAETGFSYQRKDSVIRYPSDMDSLKACNYVMYQNTAYSDKWIYAFITKMEYVNDELTNIYIETDVMQTYAFDYDVKPSFVEREHTGDDRIGVNTVPEGLELGEFIVDKFVKFGEFEDSVIVVGSTVNLKQMKFSNEGGCSGIGGTMYGGVFSGVKYYVFPLEMDSQTGRYGYDELTHSLSCLASMGQSDAIVSIFMCPKNLIDYKTTGNISVATGDTEITIREVSTTSTPKFLNWDSTTSGGGVFKPTSLDGYIPYNKKLFTFPYCYILMSNNAGGSAIYHYEKFENDLCTFQINSVVTPGFSSRLIPLHYNGITKNDEEGINAGKFPICSWNTDIYTNWLTQNSVNIGLSIGSSLLTAAGGIALMATGGGAMAGAGALTSGLLGVGSAVGEIYQHSLIPPQAEGNVNNGDVIYTSGNLTFSAYQMSIKEEYARIIDEYFNMFGYKTNRVKTPNKNHRRSWWYTKTIDVNIDGAIPNEDMRKIKDCYNKGITFWRKETIGQYANDNSIGTGW